jgi:uncharacterized cupredoxin-like copper-binding protein
VAATALVATSALVGPHTASGGHQRSGGVGGPADPDDAARAVKITTLDTTRFDPSRITVSAGETVTFVVTNTGQAVHDFTLGDAAMHGNTPRRWRTSPLGWPMTPPTASRWSPERPAADLAVR